ncbi:lactate permease [Paenibacillus sp. J45TS6]|uniref:L-lactate permease n=1 Tax=unclassified Paenibacillus TaxID=185978 RepID=UPI001B106204|nr:L-lactate permease [Paenibacillus sp. J45TS6]GIP43827.1 lactate permease [Paenibacillus sp. J45TS6]
MDHQLPITLSYWTLSLLPLIALLVMMVWFSWSGAVSGGIALALSLGIAFIFFNVPWDTALVGIGKGVWDAFFILLVVWPALLIYQVADKAGAFKAIRKGIEKYSQNYLFLVLAFGWIFSSILQGIAGFGAPIAIVTPLLIGLGVKPYMAIVIALIGHAWGKMFGTLAVGWMATLNVVDIENQTESLLYHGILLWIPNLLGGFMICYLFAKWKGIRAVWPFVFVVSLIQGGGQLALLQVNPTISAFVPATLSLGAVIVFSRFTRYKERNEELENASSIFESPDEDDSEVKMPLHTAFMPYYVLTGLSIAMLGVPFILKFLESVEFGFAFPEVSTGFDYTTESESAYSPIAPFTHPGLYLFISSIFGYFWYKTKGHYKSLTSEGKNPLQVIGKGTASEALGASMAIIAFLTVAQTMEHSGQTNVLALGIAAVSSPVVYAALASMIGVAGAYITSSSTSANVLFSPLHASVVESMDGLKLEQVIASQSAGGAVGNVVAPANIILGTSTAGIKGKETKKIYKPTLIFLGICTVCISAVAVLFHLMFN